MAAQITPGDIRYARTIGRRLGRRFKDMEFDDMESIALLALVETAKRWRPDGGAALRSLLWVRIKGALIDEQRAKHQGRTEERRRSRVEMPTLSELRNRSCAQRQAA